MYKAWVQPLHQVWYRSSEVVKNIFSGQHLVYRQTDRPTYQHTDRHTVAKQYDPFFKGGIKIEHLSRYGRWNLLD